VRIEYSTDGGSTWSEVVATTENDGGYEWLLPAPPTRNGRVRIVSTDNAATADTSDEFEIHMVGIEAEKPAPALPEITRLGRIGPNPTNSKLAVSYQIARPTHVRLAICDITGRVVRMLIEAEGQPGRYSVNWDGRDRSQAKVPAGVYVCVLEAAGVRATRHVTVVR
jgi:hypothetical protein